LVKSPKLKSEFIAKSSVYILAKNELWLKAQATLLNSGYTFVSSDNYINNSNRIWCLITHHRKYFSIRLYEEPNVEIHC